MARESGVFLQIEKRRRAEDSFIENLTNISGYNQTSKTLINRTCRK